MPANWAFLLGKAKDAMNAGVPVNVIQAAAKKLLGGVVTKAVQDSDGVLLGGGGEVPPSMPVPELEFNPQVGQGVQEFDSGAVSGTAVGTAVTEVAKSTERSELEAQVRYYVGQGKSLEDIKYAYEYKYGGTSTPAQSNKTSNLLSEYSKLSPSQQGMVKNAYEASESAEADVAVIEGTVSGAINPGGGGGGGYLLQVGSEQSLFWPIAAVGAGALFLLGRRK